MKDSKKEKYERREYGNGMEEKTNERKKVRKEVRERKRERESNKKIIFDYLSINRGN